MSYTTVLKKQRWADGGGVLTPWLRAWFVVFTFLVSSANPCLEYKTYEIFKLKDYDLNPVIQASNKGNNCESYQVNNGIRHCLFSFTLF